MLTTGLFFATLVAPSLPPDSQPVAFVNVNVLPMDRERVLEDYTVVVRNGRIVAFGPAAEVRVGSQSTREVWLVTAPAGVEVTLVLRPDSRFGYLAVRGGLDVPMVLGSCSTYLPGGFGGFLGRRLQAGDRLPIGTMVPLDKVHRSARDTAGYFLNSRPSLMPEDLVLTATQGPQWDRFDKATQELLFGSRPAPFNFGERFIVDRASDRTGYRLIGPALVPREEATLPSEPACPGAIQIPDNGQPIVLMRDGPTVGGYPKIAVVAPLDLARLAQLQPGAGVRFWDVTPRQAG